MKRSWFLVLALILIPGLVMAQDEGRGDGRGNERGGHGHGHAKAAHRPARVKSARPAHNAAVRAVSPQFHSMGVHSYPKTFARNQIMVDRVHTSIAMPNRGPGGVAIHANLIARTNFSSNVVVRNHMSVIMAPAFRASVVGYCANERLVNHYYWHTYGGFNFCHYYDPYGYHWYGWYLGNSYFWTRWYSNHYWWYDPTYYRWCYWHDGGWWWQDPNTTTIYIYNNGSYVNSNSSAQAPAAKPAPASTTLGTDYFSPDSSREVKVVGVDAFLYDSTGNNTFNPLFLGTNVTDVKFSKTNQIMLMYKDGSFATFDMNGNPMSGSASPQSDAAPDDQEAPQSAPQAPPAQGNPPPVPGTNS